MTRRPLPKIDPQLDWSAHLRTIDQLPLPFSSAAIFGRQSALEIEIGSGKGLFLSRAAAAQPDHDFLGVEVSERYATFSAARLTKLGLTNAMMIHGDAGRLFGELLPDNAAAAIHIYFPDPWWKKRHKKRRVINEAFLCHVQRVLAPAGVFHFWTDVEEYYQTTVAMVQQATQLAGPFPVTEQMPEHDLDFRTHFERRTRLHGEPVHRAEFRKAQSPAQGRC